MIYIIIVIYTIARVKGQYGEIFNSRVAVLAQPQGGTIQKLRAEYSPYYPTIASAITVGEKQGGSSPPQFF